MSKSILLNVVTIAIVVIIGLTSYIQTPKVEKRGFVFTNKVFEGFHGKVELEKRLSILKSNHQQQLDSMVLQIQKNDSNSKLESSYKLASNKFMMEEEELSRKYTSIIWKQINQYTSEYGKEKGYDFIFGASGDGNLMFANEENDITEEIISFINKKYEGE